MSSLNIVKVLHFGTDEKRRGLLSTIAGVVVEDGSFGQNMTMQELFTAYIDGVSISCDGKEVKLANSFYDPFGIWLVGDVEKLASYKIIPHCSFDRDLWQFYMVERDKYVENINEYWEDIKKKRKLKRDKEKIIKMYGDERLDLKSFDKMSWSKLCKKYPKYLNEDMFPYLRFIVDWEVVKGKKIPGIVRKTRNLTIGGIVCDFAMKLLSQDRNLNKNGDGNIDVRKCKLAVKTYLDMLPDGKSLEIIDKYKMYGVNTKVRRGSLLSADYRNWLNKLPGDGGYLISLMLIDVKKLVE